LRPIAHGLFTGITLEGPIVKEFQAMVKEGRRATSFMRKCVQGHSLTAPSVAG
jgi:hypothetical protein